MITVYVRDNSEFKSIQAGREVMAAKAQSVDYSIPVSLNDMFVVDEFEDHIIIMKDENLVPSSSTNIVTMYHGTWNNEIEFVEMEVENYNSIGTWTTESIERAMMYGAHVVEVKAVVNNAYQVKEDFFQFFGGNDKMMNGRYIAEMKRNLMEQGYDAIVFKDSKIDLGGNEGTQTVIVLLNPSEQIVEYQYMA